jgi:hypothetical protein
MSSSRSRIRSSMAAGILLAAPFTSTSADASGAKAAVVPVSNYQCTLVGCPPYTAVGAPRADAGSKADAGAVQVTIFSGPSPGKAESLWLTAGSLGFSDEAGARFGAAVAVWRNGLEPADVLIGAPGATVDGVRGAGAVYIVYGSRDGLGQGRPAFRLTERYLRLRTTASSFGAAFAIGGSGLLIGAPTATVDGAAQAGKVVLVAYPDLFRRWVISQGHRAAGVSEPGDRFGSAVTVGDEGSYAIGAPYEDIGSARDAGAVYLVQSGGRRTTFSQSSRGIPGRPETGDRFGFSLASVFNMFGRGEGGIMIGVPGEDIGAIADAGVVNVIGLPGLPNECPCHWTGYPITIAANRAGFAGSAEAGDRLGFALSRADFNVDGVDYELAVGVPYEDLGVVRDAGSVCFVDIVHMSPSAVPARCVSQGSEDVPDVAEAGDRFGFAVGAVLLHYGPLCCMTVVGVPGEDVGTVVNQGIAQTLYPFSTLPSASEQRGASVGRSVATL